jgi:hypothetical protein
MKQFKLIHRAGPFGDCTSGYDVSIPEDISVGEFVQMVITQKPHEWGKITCGRAIIADYKHGEIIRGPDYNKLRNAHVATVSAHGGWSLMDYNIVIYPMKPRFHPRATLKPNKGFKF